MLADVPLEARSQSRRLHFFSVDLLCTWRDQACAVRMRDAFMNGFLLDIIDRLSTQKKQSRQAAVAYMSDNPKHKRMTAKRTMQAHLAWVIFILSGEYQCPPDSVRSELAFLFRRPDEARGEQQSTMK